MSLEPRPQPLDLRARKRVAAMEQIQRVALDLFESAGYDAVTIARIADAADVGERSIYRYFGTKSMLVFHDEADQQMLDLFARHVRERSPVEAMRLTLHDIGPLLAAPALGDSVRRLRLIHGHPELSAALAAYTLELGDGVGRTIAVARRRPADDLASRIHGRSIVVALAAAIDEWHRSGGDQALINVLHEALGALSAFTD